MGGCLSPIPGLVDQDAPGSNGGGDEGDEHAGDGQNVLSDSLKGGTGNAREGSPPAMMLAQTARVVVSLVSRAFQRIVSNPARVPMKARVPPAATMMPGNAVVLRVSVGLMPCPIRVIPVTILRMMMISPAAVIRVSSSATR